MMTRPGDYSREQCMTTAFHEAYLYTMHLHFPFSNASTVTVVD